MGNEKNRLSGRQIVFAIFNVILSIGAFVPVLVDTLVNGRLTWSTIVLGGIGVAWSIVAPWFIFSKNRFVFSWAGAAISVPLLLYVIESLTPAKGWFLTLALPSAALGLSAIGAIGALWIYSRIKPLYLASLTCLIASAVTIGENILTRSFVGDDLFMGARYIGAYGLIGLAVLLGVLAVSTHGFRMLRES